MAPPHKHNPDQHKMVKMKKEYLRIERNEKHSQVNSKKQRFQQLVERQKKIEQSKAEKRKVIEAKRQEREEKRKQRNKAWCKKTKKGQPIMKERIKYLLKQIESMDK